MNPIALSKSSPTMKALRTLPLFALFVFFAYEGAAQIDRSNPPEPGPPPEIDLDDPHSFKLENGLKVFVVEDHTVPMLSFYLQLDHDPILEGGKKGYVSLTGNMLDKGTENKSRQEIAEKVDGMGASLNTSGKSIYAESLRKHSPKLLDVMADVLMKPTFPKKQFEKVKKRQKSGIQQQKSSAGSIRRNVGKSVAFGKDHPYGEVRTKETIDSIQVEDLKEHYKQYWRPNVSYLAVVGDIKPEKAEKMVRSRFRGWQKAEVPSHEYEMPQPPSKNKVAVANKDGAAQASLAFGYPVELEPGDKDLLPAKLMNSILGGSGFSSRLFKNLREDKGYTYGVYSGLSDDPLVGRFFAGGNVAHAKADSSVIQIRKELKKLKQDGISKEELKAHKQLKSGAFTRELEDPQTMARYAVNIDRYDLPKDYYRNYLKRLDKVTKKEVDKAAKRYLQPDSSHIVVVGKEDSLMEQLKEFGPVQRYDAYGFEKEKAKKVSLPKDLTAKKVLKKYEKAVGGKKAIDKIEDLKRVYKGQIKGREIVMERLYQHQQPGGLAKLFGKEEKEKTAMSIKISGMMTLMEMVYDGENAYRNVRGKMDTIEGKELKMQKEQSGPFASRSYLKHGYNVSVEKGEMVQGEKAVVLKVEMPNGNVSRQYYSLDSGLLLKTVSEQEGPQGKTQKNVQQILSYKEKNGLKFPSVMKTKMGAQKIELELDELQLNQGLKEEAFKL